MENQHFIIIDIATGKIIKRGNCPQIWVDLQYSADNGEACIIGECAYDATHIIDGEPITIVPEPPEPIPPTEAEIVAALTRAVQNHLDTTARQRNYDGILSLCSYATSLDPTFKAEGQTGVEWRDACWRISYQIMAEVQAGTRAIPTAEELVGSLPVMAWPT